MVRAVEAPGHAGPVSEVAHVDREVPTERLELGDGAWVDVMRDWLKEPDEVLDHLLSTVAWQTSRLFRYDHFVEERRVGAGWRPGTPLPHPALAEATRALQHRYRVQFDGFAMIRYRDGRDGQAFHRDTDMRWLDDTIIAILTLGAQRPWLLRPRSHASRRLAGEGCNARSRSCVRRLVGDGRSYAGRVGALGAVSRESSRADAHLGAVALRATGRSAVHG